MFGNAYQNGHYFEVWDSKGITTHHTQSTMIKISCTNNWWKLSHNRIKVNSIKMLRAMYTLWRVKMLRLYFQLLIRKSFLCIRSFWFCIYFYRLVRLGLWNLVLLISMVLKDESILLQYRARAKLSFSQSDIRSIIWKEEIGSFWLLIYILLWIFLKAKFIDHSII